MRIIVLGAGRVGSAMAIDLVKDPQFDVTAVDRSTESLEKLSTNHKINLEEVDLTNKIKLKKLISGYDLVIDAVPGFMGFDTFKTVINSGKDIIDIAFFPENPFLLDQIAKDRGVTAIMDCGVAPGMSNLLVGYVDHLLDKTESAMIYVGGLPTVRQWPYDYKAVFSPIDVIEEYTRPARYVENGNLVVREALSDPEFLEFPEIGTLEAFNTDGLRTLIETIDAPNMKEKTLRYPGHIEKMAILRESGFFSQEKIEIEGIKIRPLDFTAKLLFPLWELKQDEEDITVMKIEIIGQRKNKKLRCNYDLFDCFDRKSNTTSMARTTGYTATVVARLLATGIYHRNGVCPLEYLGKDPQCVEFILNGLKERNIFYKETTEIVS
jgi:lysine 6-dehydrogenase